MDIPPETERYIKEIIDHSLDLPVSSETLQLKLIASEDARCRLQDKVFLLEDRVNEASTRLEKCKAEASMNAHGLRKCIQEKEEVIARCVDLTDQNSQFQRECVLYDQDIERLMESYDELGKDNEELKTQLNNSTSVLSLVAEVEILKQDKEDLQINLSRTENLVLSLAAEVETLKQDKEHLRENLLKAEDEAKVLFEEGRILDKENKRLLKKLNKEKGEESNRKKCSHEAPSGSASSFRHRESGKRKSPLMKSSCTETILFNLDGGVDSERHPLSPLQPNSPNSRRLKK
ncbi:hypothetical protein ZOSMA_133G00260 [Zostera marina]|uniref:Uncharacterized protein n=1 Tax=Zostera marina TaxID=29655 RepID=A0A0K9Q0Z3_ZOSMR|nr:hypothetical protein ZOSMA_133G00260 [Zostera marina]